MQVLSDDLSAEVNEDLVDVGSSASRCLIVRGIAPALGEREGASTGHRAVLLQVGFITYDDDGDFLVIFDADDLFA